MDVYIPVTQNNFDLQVYDSLGIKLTILVKIQKMKEKCTTDDAHIAFHVIDQLNKMPFTPFKLFGLGVPQMGQVSKKKGGSIAFMSMELPILDITNVQRISILSQRSIDFVAKGKLYQYIGQNRDRCTVMVAPEAFVERL
ncbi:hypothetical protein G6F42_014013 [Rhizopus arrhizus]|nr:hypothetical protein G6F42_014013 [Rhizopus arrhizus]